MSSDGDFARDFFEDKSQSAQLKKFSENLSMFPPLCQLSNQTALYKNVLSEAVWLDDWCPDLWSRHSLDRMYQMLSVQPVVIHYCDLSEHTLPDLALQIYRSEPLLPSECHLSASSILYQVILLPSKQRQTIISYNKHTQKHPLHNSVYTLHKCNSTTIIYLKPLHAVNEFLPLQNCCKSILCNWYDHFHLFETGLGDPPRLVIIWNPRKSENHNAANRTENF